LETAATGNETVGKMSSFRGANTLFEGQQINGKTPEKRDIERRYREERHEGHNTL
jgi:hypothetical protein